MKQLRKYELYFVIGDERLKKVANLGITARYHDINSLGFHHFSMCSLYSTDNWIQTNIDTEARIFAPPACMSWLRLLEPRAVSTLGGDIFKYSPFVSLFEHGIYRAAESYSVISNISGTVPIDPNPISIASYVHTNFMKFLDTARYAGHSHCTLYLRFNSSISR